MSQTARRFRIALVGPLPPPFAGMPAQVIRWAENLRQEGHAVRLVSTLTDLRRRPIRREIRFLWDLARAILGAEVVNVHTGSDASFHAFATPSILLGRLAGRRTILTYKGGAAERFLPRSPLARLVLRCAHAVTVPSTYLQGVLGRHGVAAAIVPNILDPLEPATGPVPPTDAPVILVTRNLEPIYSVETAILAFGVLRASWPQARLEVYGDGAERARLEALVARRAIGGVRFHGNVAPAEVVRALRHGSLFLNPSSVDNTPNSLLEALHAGLPVVSTNVGGIPHLVQDQRSALLVPPGDPDAMAEAARRVLDDPALAARLTAEGRQVAQGFLWPLVYRRYAAILASSAP